MSAPILFSVFGMGGPELLIIGLVLFFIGTPLWIAPAVLAYVLLGRIPPTFRKQDQALALLLLIPIFSLVWAFFVFPRISASLQSYYLSLGRADVGDCGNSIAIAACVCCLGVFIPFLGAVAGIAALVLLVIFFVKAFDLTAKIPRELRTA